LQLIKSKNHVTSQNKKNRSRQNHVTPRLKTSNILIKQIGYQFGGGGNRIQRVDVTWYAFCSAAISRTR